MLAWMSMHHMYAVLTEIRRQQIPWKRWLRSPRWVTELSPGPLQEQVLVTTDPSLHPQRDHFCPQVPKPQNLLWFPGCPLCPVALKILSLIETPIFIPLIETGLMWSHWTNLQCEKGHTRLRGGGKKTRDIIVAIPDSTIKMTINLRTVRKPGLILGMHLGKLQPLPAWLGGTVLHRYRRSLRLPAL